MPAATATRLPALPRRARQVLGSPLLASLTAPHGVSRYLEMVSPLWSLDTERAVVTAVRREAGGAATLTLRPASPLPFLAGQHVRIAVEIDGARRGRTYSVSSSQHRAGTFDLTVKAHPQGLVSGHVVANAAPGLVVDVQPAAGAFTLPADRPAQLLLVSGGSGITPTLSHLATLADEGHTGRIAVLHYARSAAGVIGGDRLGALAARLPRLEVTIVPTRSPVLKQRSGRTHDPVAAGARRGHLVAQHLDGLGVDRREARAYVCGPLDLVEAVTAIWTVEGLRDLLLAEWFAPRVRALPDPGATGTLTFAGSGRTVRSDGRSLLDQAESAGLAPASGCRMGICRTCVRPKSCGTVRDLVTGATSGDGEEEVALCTSVALGDVTIDL